jgi:hypothetical protein
LYHLLLRPLLCFFVLLQSQASSKALESDLLRKKLSASESSASALRGDLAEREAEMDALRQAVKDAEAAASDEQEKAAEEVRNQQHIFARLACFSGAGDLSLASRHAASSMQGVSSQVMSVVGGRPIWLCMQLHLCNVFSVTHPVQMVFCFACSPTPSSVN